MAARKPTGVDGLNKMLTMDERKGFIKQQLDEVKKTQRTEEKKSSGSGRSSTTAGRKPPTEGEQTMVKVLSEVDRLNKMLTTMAQRKEFVKQQLDEIRIAKRTEKKKKKKKTSGRGRSSRGRNFETVL